MSTESKILILWSLVWAALVHCQPLTEDQKLTVQKLRAYCAACHAVGNIRFIRSEDDEQVWTDIQNETAPHSHKKWVNAILEVLKWPSEAPPSFDDMMDPPDRDWMPKGAKRLRLAEDQTNGIPTRKWIVQELSK